MNKQRIEKLIPIANNALIGQMKSGRESVLQKSGEINSTYDGKIAAFGVSVALSGLRPALAMYFNESGSVNPRLILELIAEIIKEDGEYVFRNSCVPASGLLEHAFNISTDQDTLKRYVLESAIALKLVVRTFKLVKN